MTSRASALCHGDEGLTLESVPSFHGGNSTLMNSFDTQNFHVSLSHGRSTTVSLETRNLTADRLAEYSYQIKPYQDDCWRKVHHSRHTIAGRDAHNYLKMSTAKTFVTHNRFEPSGDDEDVRTK